MIKKIGIGLALLSGILFGFLLRSYRHWHSVMAFESNSWMLWNKSASTWAWKLIPIDSEFTRLIIRLKCQYRWTRPTIVTDLILLEIGDFPMMRKLMIGIKQRAEQVRQPIPIQHPRVCGTVSATKLYNRP